MLNRKPDRTTAPLNDRKIYPCHDVTIATDFVLQNRLR
jgi:hypothetical protein